MNRPTSTAAVLLAAVIGLSAAAEAKVLSAAGEGRRLYLKFNCYGCHGMHGTGGMGPRLIGQGEVEDVIEAVMEGQDDGMPSYAKLLSTTDARNLAAYIRTLGTAKEPTFNHWWEDKPGR